MALMPMFCGRVAMLGGIVVCSVGERSVGQQGRVYIHDLAAKTSVFVVKKAVKGFN